MFTIRYRSVLWFAAGVAITIALVWSLLAWRAFAAPSPNESTIVSVTPTRVLDTRDPVNLGLVGPFVSPTGQKLQVTGSIPTSGGSAVVVPAGSTGVLLNVTAVSPTGAGFISIRPGDASGAPSTSSLNVQAGENVPNAVQVALPVGGARAGQIDITYDAYGVAGATTDVLIDVVGYTTNVGIQSLVADLALKANAADVYSKSQVDTSNANSMLAGGVIESSSGVFGANTARFGTSTSSKVSTGHYTITIPGLRPGCTGPTPFIQLTAWSGVGAAANTVATSTNCLSGDVTFDVYTRDLAGGSVDATFAYVVYKVPSSGRPITAPLNGPTSCTLGVDLAEVCE